MNGSGTRRAGVVLLAVLTLAAVAAPALSPTDPRAQHAGFGYAPPMRPRMRDAAGHWRWPYIARLSRTGRPSSTPARDNALPLAWLHEGRLLTSADPSHPLLLLGADALGRDVWARLVYGARTSLGLAAVAVAGASLLGVAVGLIAGWRGGWVDALLMRTSDLLVVLPALYVVLLFRASMDLVPAPSTLFFLMAVVLALAGWPTVARGVRAVAAVERQQAYVEAARGFGAGDGHILRRHLVPAVVPIVATQAVLLLPGFVVAEATLSFIGLGFAEPTASWGTLLRESYSLRVLREAPWLLSPALAIALVTVAANLVREGDR